MLEAELSSLLSIRHVEDRELPLAFSERDRVVYVRHDGAAARPAVTLGREGRHGE